MGTSKGYSAPTSPEWRKLKGKVTRLANEGALAPSTARSILGNYIQTNGGAKRIAQGEGTIGRGRVAQKIARNVGGFFSSIGGLGFVEALRQSGLGALAGKPVKDIIFSLLDYLGGPANTIDEVDARNALSRVLDELLQEANDFEGVEKILEETSRGDALGKFLILFFGYYLYEQFCRVFYERLVTRVGESKAELSLGSILEYIQSALRLKSLDQDISRIDWAGAQGQQLADNILQTTLEVFGG
jgi:hypothetical protein